MVDIELRSLRSSMCSPILETIPLSALQPTTREALALYLDAIKILASPDGYCRDWRGLLQLSGLTQNHSSFMAISPSPTKYLITILEKDSNVTFASFRQMLCDIDRWDVFEDTNQMFYDDAKMYLRKPDSFMEQQSLPHLPSPSLPHLFSPVSNLMRSTSEESMRLTMHDGIMLEHYDAFVLFHDEDVDFAKEVIDYLSNFNFKLCHKELFLAGVNFEHDAIRQLLTERCNRLIVILSPDFIDSPLNAFISNLAQSLGIFQRKRKIIPCLYRTCELPPTFHHLHLLDFQRSHRFSNFWEKLRISLQRAVDNTGSEHSFSAHNNNTLLTSEHKSTVATSTSSPVTNEFENKNLAFTLYNSKNWSCIDDDLSNLHSTERNNGGDQR